MFKWLVKDQARHPFLCVSMMLALNNLLRRVVAHSDKIAITSGNRMSLTGCNGLDIVSDIS